jgi:hypothetical protein
MAENGKGDNFGAGLPAELFATISGLVSGANARGTVQEQAAVLLEIATEENVASHPSNGTTSMVEAMLRYAAVAQATDELAATPIGAGVAQTAAINKLTVAIHNLGKKWADFGPVRDAFLDSTKKT